MYIKKPNHNLPYNKNRIKHCLAVYGTPFCKIYKRWCNQRLQHLCTDCRGFGAHQTTAFLLLTRAVHLPYTVNTTNMEEYNWWYGLFSFNKNSNTSAGCKQQVILWIENGQLIKQDKMWQVTGVKLIHLVETGWPIQNSKSY